MPVLAEEATSFAVLSQAGLAEALWHPSSSLFYPILLLLTAPVPLYRPVLPDSWTEGHPHRTRVVPPAAEDCFHVLKSACLRFQKQESCPFASQSSYSRNTAHTGS